MTVIQRNELHSNQIWKRVNQLRSPIQVIEINNPVTEIFQWKSLLIEQDEHVLKIGTDAVLLGTWIPSLSLTPRRILDVGTGSGVLALLLSESYPNAQIVGIDTDENAVKLAQANFFKNAHEKNIEARYANILQENFEIDDYDLIVSNPPYYFNQLQSRDINNNKAKHAIHPPDKWMFGLAKKTLQAGDICIVVPYDAAFTWIKSANKFGMYCHHRLNVSSFPSDKLPVRTLLHFNRSLVNPVITSLSIYEVPNKYTDAYLRLTGIALN